MIHDNDDSKQMIDHPGGYILIKDMQSVLSDNLWYQVFGKTHLKIPT